MTVCVTYGNSLTQYGTLDWYTSVVGPYASPPYPPAGCGPATQQIGVQTCYTLGFDQCGTIAESNGNIIRYKNFITTWAHEVV